MWYFPLNYNIPFHFVPVLTQYCMEIITYNRNTSGQLIVIDASKQIPTTPAPPPTYISLLLTVNRIQQQGMLFLP